MIRGMARLNRDKSTTASGGDLIMGDQFAFDNGAIILHLHNAGHQSQRLIRWRGPAQLDGVIGRYRAGRMIGAITLHQEVSRGPVAVAIEQRANDATAKHAAKRFLISLRLKVGYYLVALNKAADPQTLLIGWAAAEAGVLRSVGFLQTLVVHKLNWF